MSVELQIRSQIDEIAATKQALVTALAGRSSSALWTLVDAAGDIPYENRVKGTNIYAVDQSINSVSIQTLVADWFRLHNEYFQQDAGLTVGSTPVTSLKSAVETYYRWRVPQYFNDLMTGALGQGIALSNVFPRGDLSLGSYAATGTAAGTFTDGSSLETTLAGPGMVNTIVTHLIGANDLVLSVTCKYEDGTTVAVGVTLPTTSAVGTKKIVGQQALTSNHTAASDNGVVLVAATGQFKVGQKVLVKDTNGQEVAQVLSLVANTSLTLTTVGGTTGGLRNNYTTAATATVTPLFTDVTAITNSNGTSADAVSLAFEPDRTLTI